MTSGGSYIYLIKPASERFVHRSGYNQKEIETADQKATYYSSAIFDRRGTTAMCHCDVNSAHDLSKLINLVTKVPMKLCCTLPYNPHNTYSCLVYLNLQTIINLKSIIICDLACCEHKHSHKHLEWTMNPTSQRILVHSLADLCCMHRSLVHQTTYRDRT